MTDLQKVRKMLMKQLEKIDEGKAEQKEIDKEILKQKRQLKKKENK